MHTAVADINNLTKIFIGHWSFLKSKRLADVTAVDSISFSIKPGEILGLLGPNGAGKTTTIQMLLGTTSKTGGSIKYFGMDFEANKSQVVDRMNYASAYTKLPYHLTVKENLMVYAKMYHVPDENKRIKKLLAQFKMEKYEHKSMQELSAGQTTRVILAKAFLNYPELILLDEPTASLDPDSAATVREFLKNQRQEYKVAMLFTSHNMAEVSEMCDRVLFIQKGKLVAEDTPTGLARQITDVKIKLLLSYQSNFQISNFNFQYQQMNNELIIVCKEDEVSEVLQTLSKRKIEYSQISIDKPTLEDYFVKMSRGEK